MNPTSIEVKANDVADVKANDVADRQGKAPSKAPTDACGACPHGRKSLLVLRENLHPARTSSVPDRARAIRLLGQLPQPSDPVLTQLKAGNTVHQAGELPKTH